MSSYSRVFSRNWLSENAIFSWSEKGQKQPLTRNIIAYFGTEVSTRVTRILAMVFVARALSPTMFGLAAIALTLHEIVRVLTMNGIGQVIIRSTDNALEQTCVTAHRLNFFVSLLASIVQVIVGWLSAMITGEPILFFMSLALASTFLASPIGFVRLFRAARRNDVHIMAHIAHRQITAENLITLALALSGFGAWSLVLSKVLTTPIWVAGAQASDNWRYRRSPSGSPVFTKNFLDFCLPVLGTEGLKAARLHLDKLIIVSFFGISGLGIYYFLMNIGLGLSLTFGRAFSNCIMPHICCEERAGSNPVTVWRSITTRVFVFAMLIFGMQALLAPVYVPLIFGDQWADYGALVALMCLAATPRFLSECSSQLLRIVGRTKLEVKLTAFVSTISLIALLLAACTQQLIIVAFAIPITAWIIEPAITLYTYKLAKRDQ